MQDQIVQVDLPEGTDGNKLCIRANERSILFPKVPPEPSAYLKGKNYSRAWILQDGREVPEKGTETRGAYAFPRAPKQAVGIRKRMLTNFFWEQMLEEVIAEMANPKPVSEYCTEYDANYIREHFEPKTLEKTENKDMHIKYPVYGTGSSAITYYSQTIHKSGPGEILEKFRKSQHFTKPMEVRMDNGWVL